MKKIVLFGSGAYGLKALNYFGVDKVFAFCDNFCEENGEKNGIRYITYENLLEINENYIVIVSMNVSNSHAVSKQLLKDGIKDFLLMTEDMIQEMEEYDAESYFGMIQNDAQRFQRERNQFITLANNVESQFALLKSLVDIKDLKSATGYISQVQKNVVVFLQKLFAKLNELDIKPFAVGGTLLGIYRYNGFIPWDDDVDFGLIRNEYARLIEYGKKNWIYVETKAAANEDDNHKIEELFKQCQNKYIMVVSPNCMQIRCGTSEIDAVTVDFFAYDFYRTDYSFERHKEVMKEAEIFRYNAIGNTKVKEIINKCGNTCQESDKIYFGLDNMDSFTCPNDTWIARHVIYPLKTARFEDMHCYIPNNIEKMLSYFYRDYKQFPQDLLCHHLLERREYILKKDYVYCGIVIEKLDEIEVYTDVYTQLRQNGIYAVFVFCMSLTASEKLQIPFEYIDSIDKSFDMIISKGKIVIQHESMQVFEVICENGRIDLSLIKKNVEGIKQKNIYVNG